MSTARRPGADARVIRRKVAVPPQPERLVARPRIDRLLADLIDRHQLVWVCATAGAGKTTAVSLALPLLERRVAWLTLDDTDAAAGRLVTYLEAALGRRGGIRRGRGHAGARRPAPACRGRRSPGGGGGRRAGGAGDRRAGAAGRGAGRAGGDRRGGALRAADAAGGADQQARGGDRAGLGRRAGRQRDRGGGRPRLQGRGGRHRAGERRQGGHRPGRGRRGHRRLGRRRAVRGLALGPARGGTGRRGGRPPRLPLVADPGPARSRRARVPDHHLAARRRDRGARGGPRRGAGRRAAGVAAGEAPAGGVAPGRALHALPRAAARVPAGAAGAAGTGRGARAARGPRRAARERGAVRGRRRGVPARRQAGPRDATGGERDRDRDRPAGLRDGRALAVRARRRAAAERRHAGGGRADAGHRPRGLPPRRPRGRSASPGWRARPAGARIVPRRGDDGLELLAPRALARHAHGRLGRGRQPRDGRGPLHAQPRGPRAGGGGLARAAPQRQPARRPRDARALRARPPHHAGGPAAHERLGRGGDRALADRLPARHGPPRAGPRALRGRTHRRLGPRLAARDGGAGDHDRPRPGRRLARGAAPRAGDDALLRLGGVRDAERADRGEAGGAPQPRPGRRAGGARPAPVAPGRPSSTASSPSRPTSGADWPC